MVGTIFLFFFVVFLLFHFWGAIIFLLFFSSITFFWLFHVWKWEEDGKWEEVFGRFEIVPNFEFEEEERVSFAADSGTSDKVESDRVAAVSERVAAKRFVLLEERIALAVDKVALATDSIVFVADGNLVETGVVVEEAVEKWTDDDLTTEWDITFLHLFLFRRNFVPNSCPCRMPKDS